METKNKIKVRVAATSANLGAGFDCAGIALEMYNYFQFERLDSGLIIEGCDKEYATSDNLAYIAYKAVCDRIGKDSSVKITFLEAEVPVSRGLGSSATLICAGAYAANKLHSEALEWSEVFEICNSIEGHPDNIAPALFGSLCVSLVEKHKPYAVRFPVSEKLHFTVFIPDFEVKTSDARAVLPASIKREDAIYNMSRAALLAHAFGVGDLELIKIVTEDKLHQKYRKQLFKNIEDIKNTAYECGASAFTVSGAGSTCLAISGVPIEDKVNAIIKNMPNGWVAKELKISENGTTEVL